MGRARSRRPWKFHGGRQAKRKTSPGLLPHPWRSRHDSGATIKCLCKSLPQTLPAARKDLRGSLFLAVQAWSQAFRLAGGRDRRKREAGGTRTVASSPGVDSRNAAKFGQALLVLG